MTEAEAHSRLLLADHDSARRDAVLSTLMAESFLVDVAGTDREAVDRFGDTVYDLVVVGSGVPRHGGTSLCRALRSRSEVPIVFLTAANAEAEVVEALTAGADDCIASTERARELVARVRAALRRRPPDDPFVWKPSGMSQTAGAPQIFDIEGIRLDTGSFEVTVHDRRIEFPLKEFEVLALLMANAGRTITRRVLLNRIWGAGPSSGSKTLDAHIRRVRAKIEDNPSAPTRIVTIRGLGYRYNQ
jgi:two-component system response regulator RegX3